MTNSITEVKAGADFLAKLAETLTPESSIRQAMVLFAIAMAGDSGTDSATLEKKLGLSAAAVSRTIRVLGEVSYDKSEGRGLVSLELDPMDNRRRIIRLNSKGARAVNKLAAMWAK